MVLETSTLPIEVKEDARQVLAAHGISLLDCPLSGTGEQARRGDVVAYLSGDEAAKAQAAPVAAAMTRGVHDLGPFGNGSKMKFIANLLVAVHNVAAAEALLLAGRAGLDLATVLEAVGDGAGTSRMFEVRGPLMAAGEYPAFGAHRGVRQGHRDHHGRSRGGSGTPTPLFSLASVFYRAALAQGRGDEDDLACVLRGAASRWRPTGASRRHSVIVEWDVPVAHGRRACALRADVFRPGGDGRYPVILSCGPYAKGLAFQDGYPDQWRIMSQEASRRDAPARAAGIQNWEVVDPEKWVPDGYACVRVDSRGAGRSPGLLDPFSPRETRDLYECIEWAARQPWSNGKVGLAGISYYAMNQWQVAGAAAAAPGRDVRVGGRGGLLPRRDPSRRHPVHVLGELVPAAGHHGPARRG